MRFAFSVLLHSLVLVSLHSAAQSADTIPLNASTKRQTDSLHKSGYRVEIESRFPGGAHAWIQYLSDNLRYPKKAVKRKVEGTVVVLFIVEKDGTISNVSAESGDPLLTDEAVRIVKASPAWIPARGDGKPLRSFKKQPISFMLPK